MAERLPWHHSVKLNPQKAREIRIKHAAGETVEQLALEYGVSVDAARDVVKYLTWAFAGPESRVKR